MKKLASALIATTLLAAACGSNAAEVVASAPDVSVEEVVTTETPTSETAATDAPSTTTTAVKPSATAGSAAANSSADSDYCEISRILAENEPELDLYNDPEAFQIYMTGLMVDLERMTEVVPPEIEADFALLKESLQAFEQLLIDSNWDFAIAAQGMDELFSDNPEYDAAGDALDAYDRDVCGIDNGDFTTAETIDG